MSEDPSARSGTRCLGRLENLGERERVGWAGWRTWERGHSAQRLRGL
jgi:hypothetical protein